MGKHAKTTKSLIRKLDSKIEFLWREFGRFQIVAQDYPSAARLRRAFRDLENVHQQCVVLLGALTSALPDLSPHIHIADNVHMQRRRELAQGSMLLGRASHAMVNIKQGAKDIINDRKDLLTATKVHRSTGL